MSWQFTVGLRVQGKTDRIGVDAEDALVAALKVKAERPEASFDFVRHGYCSLLHTSQYARAAQIRRPLSFKEALRESTCTPSRKR